MVFAVVAATFLSTLAGGIVALRSTTQLGLIIALGAGVRIGAAFFDLAPESAREMGTIDSAMLFAGIGFLAFYLLEPQGDDGLLQWGFFEGLIAPHVNYPVLRILKPATLRTRPATN